MTPIQKIFAAVAELESTYRGRSFTPDGILVGSLGEVRAAELYDIVLHPPNTPSHDAEDSDKRQIQIRTNQGDATPLKEEPQFLLALKLLKNGEVEEIYNGPGAPPWKLAQDVKPDPNGYRHVRHSKLRRLMQNIPVKERIKRK